MDVVVELDTAVAEGRSALESLALSSGRWGEDDRSSTCSCTKTLLLLGEWAPEMDVDRALSRNPSANIPGADHDAAEAVWGRQALQVQRPIQNQSADGAEVSDEIGRTVERRTTSDQSTHSQLTRHLL